MRGFFDDPRNKNYTSQSLIISGNESYQIDHRKTSCWFKLEGEEWRPLIHDAEFDPETGILTGNRAYKNVNAVKIVWDDPNLPDEIIERK